MIAAATLAAPRARLLRTALARRRLIFVQLGAAFEPLRAELLGGVGGTRIAAADLLADPDETRDEPTLIVTNLEDFLTGESANGQTLGAIRELVMRRMDAGQNLCLVSTAPRVAYGSVPGSSVLEDSAVFTIPLLQRDELPADAMELPAWRLPVAWAGASTDHEIDHVALFKSLLAEVGSGVLTSLDHAVFEVDLNSAAGLRFLEARDIEALRGAGLVVTDTAGNIELSVPSRFTQLKASLASLLSSAAGPHPDFATVVNALWYVERTIRAAVRARAMSASGGKWRGQVIPGELAAEVLKRARSDTCPTAASVRELRDPLEWLTLGELMDVARSHAYGGLRMDAVLWRRFQEQVLPVRNRVSHMRHLRNADEETMTMWVAIVRREFGGDPE